MIIHNLLTIFGNWLNGIDKKIKTSGMHSFAEFTLCDFNRAEGVFFLQVICRLIYWIHMWSFQRPHMKFSCTRLMAIIQAIFGQGGWWMAAYY
jgi:hypothetical protein